MDRTFFQIVTVDVSDPFYQSKVELKEEDDTSMLVEDIANGRRRRFLKNNDPTIESIFEIEDPTQSGPTEDMFTLQQRDEDKNHRIQEQLRLEDQFGSYSKATREQNIYLIRSFIDTPKEFILASSPHPNIDIESDYINSMDSPPLSLAPNAHIRSQLVIPIIEGSTQNSTVFTKRDFTDTAQVDILKDSYESLGMDPTLQLHTDPSASVTMTDFLEPMRPTFAYLNSTRQPYRVPAAPCLLYDVQATSVMNYNKLRIKTCIRQDASTRGPLYDDINIPIFSSPIHIPMSDSHLQDVSIKKLYYLTPKTSTIPLMIAPYSHTVTSNPSIEKVGQDTNLMSEEFERHYVTLSRSMVSHPMNSMDSHMYENLYRGIDIDNFNPTEDSISSYEPITWESTFKEYIPLPYIPEPVVLSESEKKVLQWATKQFPMQKTLIESYSLTRTPHTWFDYLSELYTLESTTISQLKSDYVQSIRSIMNVPQSTSVDEMKAHIEDKETFIRSERKRAEANLSLCYGLSIRKLYLSLEEFKQDIRNAQTLYWDQTRDPLMADVHALRKEGLLEGGEDTIYEALFDILPFISTYELKRRSHEIVQWKSTDTNTMRSELRPGDLIMVRLLNASYVYEKTVDGWTSRTTNLDELEFCETQSKGYLSLQEEQLTGKQALMDGCSFVDKTCVPNRVQKWILLLESISDLKDKLEQVDSIEFDTTQRKEKLSLIVQRFLSYTRVLSKSQTSSLGDDSWSRVSQQNIDRKNHLFTVVDEYETARAIPDFTESWLAVETVLDKHTHFDEESRAYVEPTTRSIIACEHTTQCILAAKTTDPALMGNYMRQLTHEYGNYDEVGQKAICKLCGEEIGDSVISTQEGFGADEAAIQVRTTTEVALHNDVEALPLDARRLYQQIITLRDQAGISIDESELARAASVWNATYIRPAKSDLANTFLLNVQIISDVLKKRLITELSKIRMKDFLSKDENAALIRKAGSNKKTVKDVNIHLRKKLVKEVSRFIRTVSTELYCKPFLTTEEEALIHDYVASTQQISKKFKEVIFGDTTEYRNVAYTIHALIFAIQTADSIAEVGISSVPGLARIELDTLYKENTSQLQSYLVYIYGKKTQLREGKKQMLLEILGNITEKEAFIQARRQGLQRLQAKLEQKNAEEARLISMDRMFTPTRQPFKDTFRQSFSSEHPIQDILNQYEEISRSSTFDIDPNSIAPNTWMNYDRRGLGNVDISMDDRLHRDTMAIDVLLTRFPLSMARLESMRSSNDIESIESDILAFSSQYNLQSGESLHTLLLRSGGVIDNVDSFKESLQKVIPSELLERHEDWIHQWIQSYVAYAGPIGSLIEYDLHSHSFIETKVATMRKQLQQWKESKDETVYTRYITQYRNTIRMRVGQQNEIPIYTSTPPVYAPLPQMVTSVLPQWYKDQIKFKQNQVDLDKERLVNYLTQMNIKGDQVQALSVPYVMDRNRDLYDVDFYNYLTSIYFEMYRVRKNSDSIPLNHSVSNGSELLQIQSKEIFTDEEWNRMLHIILGTYGMISEGVIEAHKAAVLARQNKERKARADAFTEEETGLNRMYRDFNLGRKFVSIDEMGIEQEGELVGQDFADAELIDDEAAADLMMGMGEDEGTYEFGEYDTL